MKCSQKFLLTHLLAIAISMALFGSSVCADTSTLATKLGPLVTDVNLRSDSDFSRRSLLGSTFVRCDLSNAKFCFADVGGARFIDCDLSNADFTGASFLGCAITDCNIDQATFTDSLINDIQAADGGAYVRFYLSESQLKSTKSWKMKDLHGYEFPRSSLGSEASLNDFDLRKAFLRGGDFRDVSFRDAHVSGMIVRAKLDFRQLKSTREVMNGRFPVDFYCRNDCDLRGLDLASAKLFIAEGVEVQMDDARIRHCTLQFSGHRAVECLQMTQSYKEHVFESVTIHNANLSYLKLDKFLLQNVRFLGCNLNEVTFSEATCASVTFVECPQFDVSQLDNCWNKRNGMMRLINIQ